MRGRKLKVHAGSEIDGLPAFDVRKLGVDDGVYEFGINKKLMDELMQMGYYAEISQSGDLFCTKV